MKKSYLLIAIALIAALVLGACGTPTQAPVETEAPVVETEAPVEVPTDAPTGGDEPAASLRIWADEQRAPVLNELGAKFLAEYNVEVVVENICPRWRRSRYHRPRPRPAACSDRIRSDRRARPGRQSR